MRRNTKNLRPILGLIFCGVLLIAAAIGELSPAAAFGGFGRMGGFGPRAGIHPAPRKPMMPQRRASGVDGPPRTKGGSLANEGSRGPGHHGIIGRGDFPYGGDGGGNYAGGSGAGGRPGVGNSNNNGGGSAGGGMPPRGERRFVPNEVITAFSPSATPQAIEQLARRYNLTQLESQSFPLVGSTLYRWRIGGRRTVGDAIGALEDERIVASVQPNYVFTLQDEVAKISPDMRGDPAQYVLGKLQIEQAHQIATGKNIPIAIIDSEVDELNPNLDGTIVKSFDALGGDEKPDNHGTAMAGAIAAHAKLLGIAPGAHLLAARAFGNTPAAANGTSFAIYKSLQWAAKNAARVVNMSFAGPADPEMHRLLAAAYAKDMVLIAAAGNAGPNSAPLYPAADPNVIAVTATDSNDRLYNLANHGAYITVAAPGVEIFALAPGAAYQITTGTSVATAHVSGIAALLLELQPSLKPADIRAIITTTAKLPASADRHSDLGAGLANAYRAVIALTEKSAAKNAAEQTKQ